MTVELSYRQKVSLWGEAAVPVLEQVASKFGGYIYYKEFAEKLIEATGATTGQGLQNWVGDPLNRVIKHCLANDLPALSALVVRSTDGKVGDGFNAFLQGIGRPRIEDPDQLEWVAAEERLKCYRIYSDHVPEDAAPALTRQFQASIDRNKPKPPPPTCSSCSTVLPVSGQCDYCN
jgi:hypothetical protein